MAKFQLAFRMKKPDDVTGGGTGGEGKYLLVL